LTNFELKLDAANVLLGATGTGKTSVLAVLRKIQDLVVRGAKIDDVFPARDLTLSQTRKEQRFEIDTCINDHTYGYGLTVEHDPDRGRMRITEESLEHDDKPIFEFAHGQAHLYHDDYTAGPKYPFDWTLSGIGTSNERSDNRKLTQFKKAIGNYIIVGTCPSLIRPETSTEDEFLEPLVENFVGWYRHFSQENMGAIGRLFDALRNSLPNFESIRLRESGESSRALKAVFSSSSKGTVDYGLDQLSDGQRALIVLYSLILLTDDRRVSLFIDEPDNYLSLREIQPWLAQAVASCGESLEQIIVVSHHPVTIDYMAGAHGRWFFRDGDGPVRVGEEPRAPSDGLTLSETIVRGWEQ
jgi:predicted ATPase